MLTLQPSDGRPLLSLILIVLVSSATAQCDRWQQRIACSMNVELDVRAHRFKGTQELTYWNNSPDTIREAYFHLYFNAFRPGSEMDVRSRTIVDPDPRVGARIAALAPEDQGWLHVDDLMQDGVVCSLREDGTVLHVKLSRRIPPGKNTRFYITFTGQVPVQVRRSGRDNKEGIAYSMTQWYPKICAYDERGWHADPYVAREFYGEFGEYDVHIKLDSTFTVAATGVLQNPLEIGHGYAPPGAVIASAQDGGLIWYFKASNVHDFAWVADPDLVQSTIHVPGGPLLRFFHQDQEPENALWGPLPEAMSRSFQFMNEHFGNYPYPEFSFAQGGDGGMEYPMLTLIAGQRNPIGVSVHESVHSWFYGVLASNEGRFPWMDEGFTEYATSEVMRHLNGGEGDPHADAYEGYLKLAASGVQEPMSMHADHYRTNYAYGAAAYGGESFLAQLRPVIGERNVARGMLRYFNTCAFKHPEPIDLERVMEKQSGLELDWYFDEWINTTGTLDYAVDSIYARNDSTVILLGRRGGMLMPLDVEVTTGSDGQRNYHVPVSLMLGAKGEGSEPFAFTVLPAWQWTDPQYALVVPGKPASISQVVIDPDGRLADMDRANNAR